MCSTESSGIQVQDEPCACIIWAKHTIQGAFSPFHLFWGRMLSPPAENDKHLWKIHYTVANRVFSIQLYGTGIFSNVAILPRSCPT